MKLTDLKLVPHCGDHPSLFNDKHPRPGGERNYFPHVHVGGDTCARPKFYKSAQHWLSNCSRNSFTVNEAGDYHGDDAFFDALTELLAAAPTMLRLLGEMSSTTAPPAAFLEARALHARLLRHDIALKPTGAGWGPYFNADGTAYAPESQETV